MPPSYLSRHLGQPREVSHYSNHTHHTHQLCLAYNKRLCPGKVHPPCGTVAGPPRLLRYACIVYLDGYSASADPRRVTSVFINQTGYISITACT